MSSPRDLTPLHKKTTVLNALLQHEIRCVCPDWFRKNIFHFKNIDYLCDVKNNGL